MPAISSCPLCKNKLNNAIYCIEDAPIFQNRVYSSQTLAMQALTSTITLVECINCSFVFNSTFDPAKIIYDAHYENEQAHSELFQHYLTSIINLFTQHSFSKYKMVEIGCGKGFFLEKLLLSGFDVIGFDPAYTGENRRVVKNYFSEEFNHIKAGVVILRHVLEHIQYPFEFLHSIGKSVDYDAKIYIEVPTLAWIMENNAFWDIFYEHCNYFTFESLRSMFHDAAQGLLFNDQYMYLIADLKDLKKNSWDISAKKSLSNAMKLNELVNQCRKKLSQNSKVAIWGAGAKGVTFANLIDPDKNLISYLIDINPKKQQHYIAKTAHEIIAPEKLEKLDVKTILVMNDNYYDEILNRISHLNINLIKLETFFT